MDKSVELILKYLTDFKAKNVALFDTQNDKRDENFIILADFANEEDNKFFADFVIKKYGLSDLPEGYNRGEWIVLVLDKIILHTFIPEKREKYNMDKLYQNQKVVLPKVKGKK